MPAAGSVSQVGDRVLLPPADWYASLPSVMTTAAVLVTDAGGGVLVVKPNYRPWWNLPGGIVEAGEPPHVCCAREANEELGLAIAVGGLLVIDWVPPTPDRKAWLGFVFDGGTISDPDRIRLQSDELDGYEFVPADLVGERLTANTAARVAAALTARAERTTIYLQNGGDRVEYDPQQPAPADAAR